MDVVYSLDGRPFRIDDDRLWDRSGRYVGKVVDGMVFNTDGTYLGEFRNDRLGYGRSHSNKRKSGHTAWASRTGISRMNRTGRMHPMGWDEFRG